MTPSDDSDTDSPADDGDASPAKTEESVPDDTDADFGGHATEPTDSTDDTDGGGSDSHLGRWRSREVEVPMRVYKTVTVFATLIAVVSVLAGFVLLDTATDRAQRTALGEMDALLALLGLGAIVFGAAVYAYSTRFRATGMGKPNTGGDEDEGDG